MDHLLQAVSYNRLKNAQGLFSKLKMGKPPLFASVIKTSRKSSIAILPVHTCKIYNFHPPGTETKAFAQKLASS